MKMIRPSITSSWNPCPVCGGHEWYAMEIENDKIRDRPVPALVAVVDFVAGDSREADECLRCGTVVV
jgi:hypothetical protein